MLWLFGIFSLVLGYCVKKNLATQPTTRQRRQGKLAKEWNTGPQPILFFKKNFLPRGADFCFVPAFLTMYFHKQEQAFALRLSAAA
jgi:hypothetical protein